MCKVILLLFLIGLCVHQHVADQCDVFTILVQELHFNSTIKLSEPVEFTCSPSPNSCKEMLIVVETDLPSTTGGNHTASFLYKMDEGTTYAPIIAGTIAGVAGVSAVAALGMMKLSTLMKSATYRLPETTPDLQFFEL